MRGVMEQGHTDVPRPVILDSKIGDKRAFPVNPHQREGGMITKNILSDDDTEEHYGLFTTQPCCDLTCRNHYIF